MRVAIIGGTGYVGSYIVDKLIANGHQPHVLVRRGHEDKLRQAELCEQVKGDLSDRSALEQLIKPADAVIFNVGILRAFPSKGITFEDLQYKGAVDCIDIAVQYGVKRFILMSANGVEAESTPYQLTKRNAEHYLWQSGLNGTVFRPSVIFGDPRGLDEFATSLMRDLIKAPLPAPLFYSGLIPKSPGGFELSPVHIEDVATAMVKSLEMPETSGRTIALGGPESISWLGILKILGQVAGKKKLMLPAPVFGVYALATLFDRFAMFPITRDQLKMLLQGNTCSDAFFKEIDVAPTAFSTDSLGYLLTDSKEQAFCQKHAS